MSGIIFSQIFPNLLFFLFWITTGILGDLLLHQSGYSEIGRYLGPLGTLLIFLSFLYSARKRKWFTLGSVKLWLKVHEILAWGGSLAIMMHSGIHLNALLPWIASFFMLVAVASGATGQYLLKSSINTLKHKGKELKASGHRKTSTEKSLFSDALVVKKMKGWRKFHKPVTAMVALTVTLHIITIFWFGGLK